MKEITTIEIFAIWYLRFLQNRYGFNLAECQINWARSQMLQGANSLSLYALAGMSSMDNSFEVDEYFLKALKELKIEIPPKQLAIENYVIFICKNITERILSEDVGCDLLANICIELQYEEYRDWYELSYELEIGSINKTEFIKLVQTKAYDYLKKMPKN